MKKLILIFSTTLIFAAASVVFAQTATTPAKNSPVRKAIITVVKKKFPKIKKEDIFLVEGNWARVVYDSTDDGATSANVILKKTGGIWIIVFDHNSGSDEGDDIDDYVKGVPDKIKYPWGH